MSQEELTPKKAKKQSVVLNLSTLAVAYYGFSYTALVSRISHIQTKLQCLATVTTYRVQKNKTQKPKHVQGKSTILNYKQIDLIVKEIGEPLNFKWTGKKFIPDEQ
jgi:hypothetical protein